MVTIERTAFIRAEAIYDVSLYVQQLKLNRAIVGITVDVQLVAFQDKWHCRDCSHLAASFH